MFLNLNCIPFQCKNAFTLEIFDSTKTWSFQARRDIVEDDFPKLFPSTFLFKLFDPIKFFKSLKTFCWRLSLRIISI